jgi:hypothetical protein
MNFPGGDPGAATLELAAMVQTLVERPPGHYRCEDLISAAAAFAGEACMRRAGDFDVDNHDFKPGAPIFSSNVDVLLSGGRSDWAEIPATSAFGGLFSLLTNHPEGPWPREVFPDVGEIYWHFAAAHRNGEANDALGTAPLTVPADHRPAMSPMRAAFEVRRMAFSRWPADQLSAHALTIIAQTCLLKFLVMLRARIDPRIALTLAMETMNAMAKTAPTLPKHVEQFGRAQRAQG